MNEFPFQEDGEIRTFSKDVSPNELQWHWDEQDRLVSILHDTDWQIQFDNELPMPLVMNVPVFIAAGSWHRVLKGTGDLKLRVIKNAVHD